MDVSCLRDADVTSTDQIQAGLCVAGDDDELKDAQIRGDDKMIVDGERKW